MKVKELIELLQEFPEDMEVFSYHIGCTGDKFKYLTHEPFLQEERFIVKGRQTLVVARPCKDTKGAKKCLVI